MLLHLGVIDQPYSMAPGPRQKKPRAGTTTTGDVAQWNENKYGILAAFVERHEADIADDLAESVAGAVETMFMGGPADADPFGGATSEIEDRMKAFLTTQEVERAGLFGVPTQAALKGVSHRRKHPYRKSNPRRPSFIDTSLMVSSYKAWVE